MTKTSKSDATDSALGFYYQACYALIVLLDSGDDDSVSVETEDDVSRQGNDPTLSQLKHTLDPSSPLTETNDGLWKTFDIWLRLFPQKRHCFFFITCAEIQTGSSLLELAAPGNRAKVSQLLFDEATRITQVVDKAVAENSARCSQKGEKVAIPYKDRIGPCREFLNLSAAERDEFLSRVTIIHRNFNVTKIAEEVEKRLSNFKKTIRSRLAERLLEWWDRRVGKSLANQLSREITKNELLDQAQAIHEQLADDNLPDDFSFLEPSSLQAEIGTTMEEQIHLVAGGNARVMRAAKARWRARNQRARWLADDIGIALVLKQFDLRLVEHWQDRHAPLCDDCKRNGWDDEQKAAEGLTLLDWSHLEAPRIVPPPRPKWVAEFLTQGTYQQLADEQKVGWHPDYLSRLMALTPKPPSSTTTTKVPTKAKPRKKASKKSPARKPR